jgi:hypothetical protein
MPNKIFMNLNHNSNSTLLQLRNLSIPPDLGVPPSSALPKAPTTFKSSMIARIHNARPGCGSCGR